MADHARVFTQEEVSANIARIIEEVCAEEGITVEEFYEGLREAWNKAIEEEVGEDWAWT